MANPHIRILAEQPYWTVSDANKMPVSIASLQAHYGPEHKTFTDKDGNQRSYYGASFKKPQDMTTLTDLVTWFPSAPNFAFYLHDDQEFAVVDVEPKATLETKQKLLKLPWLYAETSMSGNGYHLLIPYPTTLLDIFPDAYKPSIKADDNTYEVHLAHWLTFTGNVVEKDDDWGTVSVTIGLSELFQQQKPLSSISIGNAKAIEDPENNIKDFSKLVHSLCASMRTYNKTPAHFNYDMSRFDMSMLSFMTGKFIQLAGTTDKFNVSDYTVSEIATIVGTAVHKYQQSAGLDRNKYYERRDGMPFLVWRAHVAVTTRLQEMKISPKPDSN